MTRPFRQPARAPSDAAGISALLARDELAKLDAERERLKAVIASIAPRRSTIVENRLKQLTRQRLGLVAGVRRAMR
ncbi:MAG TPA: hypothetical protein VGV17_24025 [Bosea sp. (in: a-proteobacteria)]|jgi:hypothetical protein|uniref:hypothetical protein n=1 Tax=Bosea sp. (in: a-proteobacteria) TaxID=1871050 RepID=UPI002DDD221E|nr:hypothetical protein [Bosea sp. (in: a-proteobacteria)]HEV2556831.1 hypothetical protein [Bosea sp. (in: a-proteobacteria)]